MKRVFFALCFCMMCIADAMAQEIISGTIVDGKNNPLPGARVEIVGRSEVTYSDIDGIFRFDIPVKAEKIKITYVGYKPMVRKIKPDMVIKMGNGWAGKSSGFRSFFDMYGGFGFGGVVNVKAGSTEISDIHSGLNFGISYTLGYQINSNLFVGLGAGALSNMLYYEETKERYTESEHMFQSGYIPVYADVRWDFGLASKAAPYIDLKLGYQVTIEDNLYDEYNYDYYGSNDLYLESKDAKGFYFQPSVGMRTALGNKCGLNLGLSYNVSVPKRITGSYHYFVPSADGDGQYFTEEMDFGKSYSGILMFNIGFDF